MNRRELAKKGFFGLCAFLLGKLPQKKVDGTVPACGTSSNATCHTIILPAGSPGWHGLDLSGPKWDDDYSLSDGTEIEHGIN